MQNNTIRKNEYCHSSSKSMKQEDEELFQLNIIQRITETEVSRFSQEIFEFQLNIIQRITETSLAMTEVPFLRSFN